MFNWKRFVLGFALIAVPSLLFAAIAYAFIEIGWAAGLGAMALAGALLTGVSYAFSGGGA